MDKLFYPEDYETGVVVELYGLLREDFSGGRMREARAEIKAESPPNSLTAEINSKKIIKEKGDGTCRRFLKTRVGNSGCL